MNRFRVEKRTSQINLQSDYSAHAPRFNATNEPNEDSPAILRSPFRLRFSSSNRGLEQGDQPLMAKPPLKRNEYTPAELSELDLSNTVAFEAELDEAVHPAKAI